MCDTFVALGNATASGSVIFAKNSDRQPNEPHLLIRVPSKQYPPGTKLQCTYIEIDQARETYEVLLLKPSWMWGAEMGGNEFGLNIGNEAVFTREKQGPPALLGMDMLRLALERCRTSEEALHFMIELLQRYGQGGNCGYEKPFYYHNSFLIADPTSAWVLETAGQYWAAQKVKDVRAISNRLSIGTDFDLSHPDLVSHAVRRGWCRSESDFDFAKCYSNPLITAASGSVHRQQACDLALHSHRGQITIELAMQVLRSHEPHIQGDQFARSSLRSVCMHGGFLFGDHTTGSYVVSLDKTRATYWLTGSSTPCLSVFKPYWLTETPCAMVFPEDRADDAIAFWTLRERLHRLVLENRVPNLQEYLAERDALEKEFLQLAADAASTADSEALLHIMDYALEKETALVTKTIAQAEGVSARMRGNPYYRWYWKNQTRKLFASSSRDW
ncbi:MAG: peptidase U34 [Firmicutes bacterium]|jgi:secernin|nr:peptidase U34 [Bacillota bacterium]